MNPNGAVTPSSIGSVSVTSSIGHSDDDSTAINSAGSCARLAARDYAFADCSEIYLAGKRTSGIYEIW
jgi:hypothetical protein